MQMTKCKSRDDPRYQAISGVLKQFARKGLLKKEMILADPVEHTCTQFENTTDVMINAYSSPLSA
jgi:hypothetical protein